jgi:hypothetical protein
MLGTPKISLWLPVPDADPATRLSMISSVLRASFRFTVNDRQSTPDFQLSPARIPVGASAEHVMVLFRIAQWKMTQFIDYFWKSCTVLRLDCHTRVTANKTVPFTLQNIFLNVVFQVMFDDLQASRILGRLRDLLQEIPDHFQDDISGLLLSAAFR